MKFYKTTFLLAAGLMSISAQVREAHLSGSTENPGGPYVVPYNFVHVLKFHEFQTVDGKPTLLFGTRPVEAAHFALQPAPGRGANTKACGTDELIDKWMMTNSQFATAVPDPKAQALANFRRWAAPSTGARSGSTKPPSYKYADMSGVLQVDRERVKAAWERAQDYVYITKQMVDFVYSSYPQWRPLLWEEDFKPNQAEVAEEGSFYENRAGYQSLRLWFGPYSEEKLQAVHEVVNDIWSKFQAGPSVSLRSSSSDVNCDVWNPAAYHFPKNHIVLCRPKFFYNDSPGMLTGEDQEFAVHYEAMTLIHEMAHWITWNPYNFVKDGHTIGCTNDNGPFIGKDQPPVNGAWKLCHVAGFKFYGPKNAMHLSLNHSHVTYRNNDTYALFVSRFGKAVKDGFITRFPRSYDGYPPRPHSSNPKLKPCEKDAPANTPNANEYDSCSEYKGEEYQQCKNTYNPEFGLWELIKDHCTSNVFGTKF